MWNQFSFSGQEEIHSPILDTTIENIQFSSYETQVLVEISSSENVHETPSICYKSSQIYVALAINNQVIIFSNENCFKLVYEFKTETTIECLALSEDSKILIIAENLGKVHLLHLPSTKKICSFTLVEKNEFHEASFKKCFICTDSKGSLKIYILTIENILFVFYNINAADLYEGIENAGYTEILKDTKKEITDLNDKYPDFEVKQIFETYCYDQPVGLTVESCSDTSATECSSVEILLDSEFHLQNDDGENFGVEKKFPFFLYDLSGIEDSVTKLVCTRDCRYICSLNEEHFIQVQCFWTKLILFTYGNGNIYDFVLTETIDSNSLSITECKIGLLVLTNQQIYDFEIRQFPSFELIYTVRLASYAKLVNCKPNQELWYIIEADLIKNEYDRTQVVMESLKIKSVTEADPASRLLRLVHNGKFKEADKFAQVFNLEKEIIYQKKVSCILQDLSQPTMLSDLQMDSFLNELGACFALIKDLSFIQSCLTISLSSINHFQRFLQLLEKAFANCPNSEEKDKLISEINQTMSKLLTSRMLSATCSSIQWKDFLSLDLFRFMVSKLNSEELDIAFIVWQRHKDELVHFLTAQKLIEILEVIPDSMPSIQLMSFLCEDFMSTIFPRMPEAVSIMAKWLIHRAYLLEINEKVQWPNNAKELLESFSVLITDLHEASEIGEMSFSASLSLSAVNKMSFDSECSLGKLRDLTEQLRNLSTLKMEYGCKMSLADYCQDDKMSVVYMLLDRIDLKVMMQAVNHFVQKFAFENDLDLEFCLQKYIEVTLKDSYCTWWYWEEAPWEERLITIIACIQDQERWLEAALKIVFHAPIPWSKRVQDLVQAGLAMDHPKITDLKIQSHLLGLKEVLIKYDMRDFVINNPQMANTLINYILKKNKDSAFEDVKKILSAYKDTMDVEANIRYLQVFLNQNKIEEMMDFLSSSPADEAAHCANRLLQYIVIILEDRFLLKHKRDLINTMTVGGVQLLRFLNVIEKASEVENAILLSSMQKLQNEFGIYPSLSDFSSKNFCEEILLSSIDSFLEGKVFWSEVQDQMEKKRSKSTLQFSKIYRLGDLLLLKREAVIAFMVSALIKHHKYDLVIQLCRELVSNYPTTETAKTLMSVVRYFYSNLSSVTTDEGLNINIIETIYHLLSLAVSYCGEGALENCTYLLKHTEFIRAINNLNQTCSDLSTADHTNDVYYNWKFSAVYCDEGFNLEADTIESCLLMLQLEGFQVSETSSAISEVSVTAEFMKSMEVLIKHLLDKGHETTVLKALCFLIHRLLNSKKEDFMSVCPAIQENLKAVTFTIIQRTIGKRGLDLHFVLGLLNMLGEESGSSILKKLLEWCGTHTKRAMAIGKIGIEFGLLIKNAEISSIFFNMHNKMELISKLNISSVPVETVILTSDPELDWPIVNEIITSPNVDVRIVYSCCENFNVNSNNVLLSYLNHLFLGPHVTVWTNCLELPEAEINSVLRKAETVIKDINDIELVYSNLKGLLIKIDPYSYETLLFICEQLSSVAANVLTVNSGYYETSISILKFLRMYRRVSPPSDAESDEWLSRSLIGGDCKLPAISSIRLPFYLLTLDSKYKFIKSELTPQTINVWLKIAPMLKISTDELMITAVTNSVTKYLNKMKKSFNVSAYNCKSDITYLRTVNQLINKINDPEKAVACANWVCNRMPPGGNKVASISIALKIGRDWLKKSPMDSVRKLVQNLESVHHRFVVEAILYKNDLALEKSLCLVNQIKPLTEHLIESSCTSVEGSRRVFQALQEISEISPINIFDIYMSFLSKWLSMSQNISSSPDESFYVGNFMEEPEDNVDNKNMLRAINFLFAAPESVFPSLLESIVQKYSIMTKIQQSRALFCMMSVTNTETISTFLDIEADQLNAHLVPLVCTAELENLGLPYSKTFLKCSKLELIEKILSRDVKNPKVLIFCVRMSLEYNIWNSNIWKVIFEKMKNLSMTEELLRVLPVSQGHLAHLWHTEAFASAWSAVLHSLFKNDSMKPWKKIISNVYRTVLRCPCLTSLNIESLWDEVWYLAPELKRKFKEPIQDAPTFLLALVNILSGPAPKSEKVENAEITMSVSFCHITD